MTGRPNDDDTLLREAVVAALEELAHGTGKAIAVLRRRARINRRLIWGLLAVAAGQLALFIVAAFIGFGIANNSDEINHIQKRTSDQVLCPLYGAFLAAENNPVPPEIRRDPAQMKERADAFRVIHMGYDQLHCPKG